MDLALTRWIDPQFAMDHLLQSTLFAVAAALVALALTRQRAQVRYWIWAAASAKFLVPFSALIGIGRLLPWRAPLTIAPANVAAIVQTTVGAVSGTTAALPFAASSAGFQWPSLVPLVGTIWFVGCVVVAARWWIAQRRVSTVMRDASPLAHGRTIDLLRGLEQRAGLKRPLPVVTARSAFEPAIVGVIRPQLFWPVGIDHQLTDEQIEAVLVHELSHVRRCDNLVAIMQMTVGVVWWFHPLVWWIGSRLLDEREQACDEDVLRSGRAPEVYAAGILRTCEISLAAPLPCMTGITGSDLKKRIEVIMRNRQAAPLSFTARVVLCFVSVATLAIPIGIGLAMPRVHAQTLTTAPAAPLPSFEVASVKPNTSGDNRIMLGFQPGGHYVATNATLLVMIRSAYQMQEFQIIGAPDWLKTEHFDINAKGEGLEPNPFVTEQRSGPSKLQLMVRSLLADRFKLVTHVEQRDLPVYYLVLAKADGKLGPKMTPSTADCASLGRAGGPPLVPPSPTARMTCGMRMGPGLVSGGGIAIAQLVNTLSMSAQRTIVDKTGLTGLFDIDLAWTPEMPVGGRDAPPGAPPIDPNGPSLFTALQEQLGLKLESTRGPVDVLVIDSVQRPTPD